MAVTSIWPIKGRVDRVINYARNPEKTTEGGYEELASFHAVDNVVEYAANDMKTERRSYVSCLNCREDTAAAQFMDTKRLWGKLGGRVCYHGYQSFKADEVTAEVAHEIGVKLAQELWGDRFEVVVATHCNTGHYHNHFVINSVSWADGKKFYNSPADYAKMREVSDHLCREYAISVIENPGGRGKSYGEWQAEQNGKPTHRGTIRADIDRAILASTTERDFLRVMAEMGYQLKTRGSDGKPLKYPALKPPDAKGYFRFHKLGSGYSLDEIKERILKNLQKQAPFPEAEQKPPRRYRVRSQPRKKVTGLRALYFRYCYELHIIVKHPASVKRVSFLLREDVPFHMSYDDGLQDLYIHLEKGYQLLDGKQAMNLVRWRHNNDGTVSPGGGSDLSRLNIQHDFLKAVLKQTLQIKNAFRIGQLATLFRENVVSDLTVENLYWFGSQAIMGGLDVEDVNFVTMPNYGVDIEGAKFRYRVCPIKDQLLALINGSLNPFAQDVTLRQLDLIQISSDGNTLSSTTGRLADPSAGIPPVVATPKPIESTAPAESAMPVESDIPVERDEPVESAEIETIPIESVAPAEETPEPEPESELG